MPASTSNPVAAYIVAVQQLQREEAREQRAAQLLAEIEAKDTESPIDYRLREGRI